MQKTICVWLNKRGMSKKGKFINRKHIYSCWRQGVVMGGICKRDEGNLGVDWNILKPNGGNDCTIPYIYKTL